MTDFSAYAPSLGQFMSCLLLFLLLTCPAPQPPPLLPRPRPRGCSCPQFVYYLCHSASFWPRVFCIKNCRNFYEAFFFYFILQCIPTSHKRERGVWAGAGAGLVLVGCRVIAFCAAVEFKWIQYCIFMLKCAQKQIFHLHFLNGEIRITYPTGTKHWFCFCAVPHAACNRGEGRVGGKRHRWSEVSACFWSARLSVKGSDESLPAAAPLLLSTCTIPSTSPPAFCLF